MWKIRTSKLTGTVHHENTGSQVRADATHPPPTHPQNPLNPHSSQGHIFHLNTTSHKLQKEKKNTQSRCFFGYTMLVWTPVRDKRNRLLVINLSYHHHALDAGSSDLSVTGVQGVERAV